MVRVESVSVIEVVCHTLNVCASIGVEARLLCRLKSAVSARILNEMAKCALCERLAGLFRGEERGHVISQRCEIGGQGGPSRGIERNLAIFVALAIDTQESASFPDRHTVTPQHTDLACAKSGVQYQDDDGLVAQTPGGRHCRE